MAAATAAHAQTVPAGDQPAPGATQASRTTGYDAAFFAQYAPRTALDIVRRVPGFQIESGNSDTRGFAGAAGNVVITIQVQVNAAPNSALFNTAAIDPNNAIAEANEANNTASVTATVTANVDLTIAKAQSTATPAPNGPLTYTLTVSGVNGACPAVCRPTT